MEEPESIGRKLNDTTEHMNEIVTNINTREMDIDSKKRRLNKIKNQEIERNKHLQLYLEQLSSQSVLLKEAESQFIKKRKEDEEKLSTGIQESITNIDNNIQTLKKMQAEKVKNEQEINAFKDKISSFEEEFLAFEKKDFESEQVLYELVTRPFTNEEITHEIKQSENTDKAAVEAILHLTLKTIHDLRQKISEEKKKKMVLKDEFNKITRDLRMKDQADYETQLNQLNDENSNQTNNLLLYYNPITGKVDMTQFNQVDSRVKTLKRRDKRIDKEIEEINSKKPLLNSKLNEAKFSIERINNEKQRYDSKTLNFTVDFNPDYNDQLTSQISQVQTEKANFERKLKKSKHKLLLLENTESQLHKKLRMLTEKEIETEQTSLKIAYLANENHRIETENQQREHEEQMHEQMLVSELSDLQKRIAMNTAEFDEMIQKHQEFEQTILNDADWQRDHLIPAELDLAVKHINISDFGLKRRITEPFNSNSDSSSLLSKSSNFLNNSNGLDGFDNEGYSSSCFSFTESGKNGSTKRKTKGAQKVKKVTRPDFDSELVSVDSKLANRITRMRKSKDRIRRESLKILARVRSLIESNGFAMKEIRVMQAKLHQESFNLQRLQVEESKKADKSQSLLTSHLNVRTTDVISLTKERIEKTRLSIRQKRMKIDEKTEILHRIEKVSSYSNSNTDPSLPVLPNFIIQDGVRVMDRLLERKKLIQEADRKVGVAQEVLDGFCQLYQQIREELRTWYKRNVSNNVSMYSNYDNGQSFSETEQLKNWIDLMQDSCKMFRNCGI